MKGWRGTSVIRHSSLDISHSSALADAAFHFEVDEAFKFDAVFHRELAGEVVDEAVDGEAHCLAFGETALLHVEDHVFRNL